MKHADRLRDALAHASGRIVITGHDTPDVDSVISCVLMHELISRWGFEAQIVFTSRAHEQARRLLAAELPQMDAWVGETRPEDCLVLVDHNRPLHAGSVIACVDHHPTQNMPDYPYVQIESCGACALMVYRLFEEAGFEPGDRLTRLTVIAVYLDTLALRSPKMRGEDIPWVRAQAQRLGMDEAWLMREGLCLCDMARSPQSLAMEGFKRFVFGGRLVLTTHVQTDAMTQEILGRILECLRGELRARSGALWVFLVHDPVRQRSEQYDLFADGTMRVRRYDHLASRGRDVMPAIEREMEKRHEHES